MWYCSIVGVQGLSWFERVFCGHAPKGAFEVGVCRVDVFFYNVASSYTIMCVDMLWYIFLCLLNPYYMSLNIPCDSVHGEPMFVRIEVHSLPFMRAVGQ